MARFVRSIGRIVEEGKKRPLAFKRDCVLCTKTRIWVLEMEARFSFVPLS
ncbi:unnamed protein product [Arabidopsis halleri]